MLRLLSAGVLLAGVLVGCATPDAPGPTEVRVLAYNIKHGRGMDGAVDLERIAAVIRASGADLVALQEVDRGTARTDRVDQPARLGALTGLTPVFEKNINFQGGAYGNAILSRFPVLRHANHPLPQMRANEQRGLLELVVDVDGREVVFAATHWDYRGDDAERMASIEVLRERVAARGGRPFIVAGDFNALPESRVMRTTTALLNDPCAEAGADGYTFPADKPLRRIDYVLHADDPALRAGDCVVLDEPLASDHRPVLVTFELAPAKRGP
jgi:endonuclease/exonuclease/phosphatase family metal-dependent hydrolase